MTGQTGAGKSTANAAFAEAGYKVYDCDLIVRELQQTAPVLKLLEENYGPEILLEDGSLNRRMLAAIAFSEPKQTEKLNSIMLPIVKEEIERRIEADVQKGQRYFLLDAPTLFESGVDKMCDRKISVLANEAVRLQRIIRRDGLTEEQARTRMNAQQKDAFYTVRSDFTLRNNGTKEELHKAASELAVSLKKDRNQDSKTALYAFVAILTLIVVTMGVYTLVYRWIYPKENDALVAVYAEETGYPEGVFRAAAYLEGAANEAEAEAIFDRIASIECEGNALTLFAEYYAGAELIDAWLATPAYSEDGINLEKIPDNEIREKAENADQTARVFDNLYS